jgi:Mg2+ and Co2+ transporter CorA
LRAFGFGNAEEPQYLGMPDQVTDQTDCGCGPKHMQTHHLRSSSSPEVEGGAVVPGEPWTDIDVGDDEGRRWLLDESGLEDLIIQNKELLEVSIDRASALQGQIRDQLSDSMNKATYRFTWVATVFLPLGFFTGLLGINVAGIPGNHDPLAF